MKLLPKVYRFGWVTVDGQFNTSYMVARSEQNAFKVMSQFAKEDEAIYKHYCVMEESWFANLLILFLPKYMYTGSQWSEWRPFDV
jgi:hypothetical protein